MNARRARTPDGRRMNPERRVNMDTQDNSIGELVPEPYIPAGHVPAEEASR
jgi:hypothetical protein